MIKSASNWILSYSKIKFLDKFTVQDFEFELMSLSDSNIEAVRLLKSSQSIIELAANGGIAINKSRIIEDDTLTDSLAAYWDQDDLKAFSDPTIMFSVGEKVCELSGLSEVLSEMIADEKAEEAELIELALIEEQKESDHGLALVEDESKVVQGDDLNMDKIEADANEYINNQQIS